MASADPPRTPPRPTTLILDDLYTKIEQAKYEKRRGVKRTHAEFESDELSLNKVCHEFGTITLENPEVFNKRLCLFLSNWMHQTVCTFAATPHKLDSIAFWTSQLRLELKAQLPRNDFLGREPLKKEMEYVVYNAMKFIVPRVREFLKGETSQYTKFEGYKKDYNVLSMTNRKLRLELNMPKLRKTLGHQEMRVHLRSHRPDQVFLDEDYAADDEKSEAESSSGDETTNGNADKDI